MKPILLICLFVALCGAAFAKPVKAGPDEIWLSVQLNVQEDDIIDTYWYWGIVDRDVYESILDGNTDGFMTMRHVRFYSASRDKYVDYADDESNGTLSFHRSTIVYLHELRGDPLLSNMPEDTDEEMDPTKLPGA